MAFDTCWLLSEDYFASRPNKSNRIKFDKAFRELKMHIDRINTRFPGRFQYAPVRTSFTPRWSVDVARSFKILSLTFLSFLRLVIGEQGAASPEPADGNKLQIDTSEKQGTNCDGRKMPNLTPASRKRKGEPGGNSTQASPAAGKAASPGKFYTRKKVMRI